MERSRLPDRRAHARMPIQPAFTDTPQAPTQRDVDEDHGIGRVNPVGEHVVELRLDDPRVGGNLAALHRLVFVAGRRDPAGLPEQRIEVKDANPQQLAEVMGKARFSRSDGTDDRDLLHGSSVSRPNCFRLVGLPGTAGGSF